MQNLIKVYEKLRDEATDVIEKAHYEVLIRELKNSESELSKVVAAKNDITAPTNGITENFMIEMEKAGVTIYGAEILDYLYSSGNYNDEFKELLECAVGDDVIELGDVFGDSKILKYVGDNISIEEVMDQFSDDDITSFVRENYNLETLIGDLKEFITANFDPEDFVEVVWK